MTILEIHPSYVAELRTVGEKYLSLEDQQLCFNAYFNVEKKYLLATGDHPSLLQLFRLKISLLELSFLLTVEVLLSVHSRN